MFDSSETVIGNKVTFLPVGKGHTIFLQFPIDQGEALAHYIMAPHLRLLKTL